MKAPAEAEAHTQRHDSTSTDRQAFDAAWAKWRRHLKESDGKPYPRVAPDHWGAP